MSDAELSFDIKAELTRAFGKLEPEELRSLWRELHAGAEVFYGDTADEDWMNEAGVP